MSEHPKRGPLIRKIFKALAVIAVFSLWAASRGVLPASAGLRNPPTHRRTKHASDKYVKLQLRLDIGNALLH